MKLILIGHGNVGAEVEKVLLEQGLKVDYVIHGSGVFKQGSLVDTNEHFATYIDSESVLFISVPSIGDGSVMLPYYQKSLEAGAKIVTCEKAVIANHWDLVRQNEGSIRYSATVGGDSGILPAIASYQGKIETVKAVVNGTLNFIAEKKRNGVTKEAVFDMVTKGGFAEPGARSLTEVIAGEINDVLYKAAIVANHSKLYEKTFAARDIHFVDGEINDGCSVVLGGNGVRAGFIHHEDVSWLPEGVTNCVYINGVKMAGGPGAGGRITAKRMYKDFLTL